MQGWIKVHRQFMENEFYFSERFTKAQAWIDLLLLATHKKQTPGKVLTMEVVQLPVGALFVYPNQQTLTSKNEVLEAVGVVPDIKVELKKEAILKGIDTQLEKAIEYLTNKK